MNDFDDKEYIIAWEKWKDPLGFDEPNESIEEYQQDEDGLVRDVKVKRTRCNVIQTPFGIIPFNENMASSEIFNFWTGHTNFAITSKVSELIEDTDGVETLNVFTKYRFRIAIGKTFTDSLVMRDINKNVYEYLKG